MDKEQDKIIPLLKKFKRDISHKILVDKLIFFGSRARGKAKKMSDIDILLVSKDFEGKKYFRRSPDFYLMWDYDYDIDIVCLTPGELSKRKKEIGIIGQALKEGIEV